MLLSWLLWGFPVVGVPHISRRLVPEGKAPISRLCRIYPHQLLSYNWGQFPENILHHVVTVSTAAGGADFAPLPHISPGPTPNGSRSKHQQVTPLPPFSSPRCYSVHSVSLIIRWDQSPARCVPRSCITSWRCQEACVASRPRGHFSVCTAWMTGEAEMATVSLMVKVTTRSHPKTNGLGSAPAFLTASALC